MDHYAAADTCSHLSAFRSLHGCANPFTVLKPIFQTHPNRVSIRRDPSELPRCATCQSLTRLYACLSCASLSCLTHVQSHARTCTTTITVDIDRSELFCGLCLDQIYDPDFDTVIVSARSPEKSNLEKSPTRIENLHKRRRVDYRLWVPDPIEKDIIMKNSTLLNPSEFPWNPIHKDLILKNPIEKNQILKVPIEKNPILKDPVEKNPILKDPIEKNQILKDPIEKNPILKDPIEKNPILKDPVEKNQILKGPIEKNPILKDPIEKNPKVKKLILKNAITLMEKDLILKNETVEEFPWGLRGMNNLGNTCFMNSVLQALLHTPPLRNYFLSDRHNRYFCQHQKSVVKKGDEKRRVCLACDMDAIFSAVFAGDRTPYSPAKFLYRSISSSCFL